MKPLSRMHWMRQLSFTIFCCALGPGAVAQEISLNIVPAVHVSWPSATNKAYQVETSSKVPGNWAPLGPSIEGSGGAAGAWFDALDAKQYFRVHEVAASGIGWLEGVWQGETYAASSNSIPFTTQLSIANNNRSFSGTFSNSLAGCTATLDLLAYSDTQASFHSRILSGQCASGVVIVSRINATNVLYNWYYPESPAQASFAVLSKNR